MTRGEIKAYSRGYSRGYLSNRWPEHKPPTPPDPIIAELMDALRSIRDACDALCATIEPDDFFSLQLGPQIERADGAMRAVSAWLKET
jgi:hypothetical protein